MESSSLQECRNKVRQAGFEIFPAWANKAIFLAPLTQDEVSQHLGKFAKMDVQDLQPHHVFIRHCDIQHLHEALRDLPKKDRPHYRFDHRAHKHAHEMPTSNVADCDSAPSFQDLHVNEDDRRVPLSCSVDEMDVAGFLTTNFVEMCTFQTFLHVPVP